MSNMKNASGGVAAREQRRVACVRWCLEQEAKHGRVNLAAAARRFGVSRQSPSVWMARYRSSGWDGLVDRHFQPNKPGLSDADLLRLGELLKQGALAAGFRDDLWTAKRIARVIQKEFGPQYHRDHVSKILRERMSFSWQKPQRVPREKNQERAQRWLQKEWPRIKGGLKSGAPPSSSSTRAVSRSSPRSGVRGLHGARHRV